MTEQLAETAPEAADGAMDLWSHLTELRRRLIYALAAMAATTTLALFAAGNIFEALAAPFRAAFPPESLIGTGPAEAFMMKLKVALFAGLILAVPVIAFQLWQFVRPGLYAHERRLVVPFVLTATALFFLGAGFCYALVLPLALEFFEQQYRSIGVQPAIKISEHLSFVVFALLSFAAVFELPLLGFLLGRAGIIDDAFLVRWWRHAVVAIFVVAAVLTPPDVISQLLMAGPLLLLYAVTIWVVRCTHRQTQA